MDEFVEGERGFDVGGAVSGPVPGAVAVPAGGGREVAPRPVLAGLPVRRAGAFVDCFRRSVVGVRLPKVVLVAWGVTPADAAAALVRGRRHAEEHRYHVIDEVASFCPVVRDAALYGKTAKGYVRQERNYGVTWWLLRHDCVTRDELDAARRLVRRMGAEIDGAYADAFRREFGYPPEAVTLAGEQRSYRFPFERTSRVEDRRSGVLPAGGGRVVSGAPELPRPAVAPRRGAGPGGGGTRGV